MTIGVGVAVAFCAKAEVVEPTSISNATASADRHSDGSC